MLNLFTYIILIISSTCWAMGDGVYQIEIIAFENVEPSYVGAQQWPQKAIELNKKEALAVDESSIDVRTILEESRILNKSVELITQSAGHEIIYSSAWTQYLEDDKQNPPVHFIGGRYKVGESWEIEGLVAVRPIRNLFHTKVDLIFRKQTNEGLKEFRVAQSGRMKARESYYFDHPVVGCIMLITPYTQE